MRERIQCEFVLVRYVPDQVKGEFTNIGVILREAAKEDEAVVRFTRDWTALRRLDPGADLELLQSLEDDIQQRVRDDSRDTRSILDLLQDTLSTCLQITPFQGCLAESIPAEMEQLLRMYVDSPRRTKSRERTGRNLLLNSLRREFERAGVWRLLRKRIPAAIYTQAGDPMKIDCGYRPGDMVRMFHAVSLDNDLEAAKVLAYSVSSLREGVFRVEQARLELTAIVEPIRTLRTDDEIAERYRFGVESMEREQIRVLTTNDLSRVAETARRELRL